MIEQYYQTRRDKDEMNNPDLVFEKVKQELVGALETHEATFSVIEKAEKQLQALKTGQLEIQAQHKELSELLTSKNKKLVVDEGDFAAQFKGMKQAFLNYNKECSKKIQDLKKKQTLVIKGLGKLKRDFTKNLKNLATEMGLGTILVSETEEYYRYCKQVFLGGPRNSSYIRQEDLHFPNKMVFKMDEGNSWNKGCIRLGVLDGKQATKFRITMMEQYDIFGFAREGVEKTMSAVIKQKEDTHPFYGIYPSAQSSHCNIPDFLPSLKGPYVKDSTETYTLTFDPGRLQIEIVGGRLMKKVTQAIKPGEYFPYFTCSDKTMLVEILIDE